MKIANVVSAQSRDNLDPRSQEERAGSRVDRMTNLLRRYPAIEYREREDLLNFLTGGPQEEIVKVTCLQGLEPRYAQFRKDHPRQFSTGFRGWLPLILMVAVALVGAVWRFAT